MFGDDSQALLERYASTNPAMQAGRGGEGATENSQVNQHFDKAFSGRKYEGNLKDYRKRSFWGRKDYARQVYGGDTDGSEFLQRAREASRQASQSGARSREAGRGLAHQPYVTGSASEAGRQGLELRSDAETETRRRVYPEPEIRNWQRRRALSVEDTRAMLGR
jgi:hypothetical protein